METRKMSENVLSPDMHKSTALRFLNDANEKLEKPLDKYLIESVYDLFASSDSDITNFQRELEKIIVEGLV